MRSVCWVACLTIACVAAAPLQLHAGDPFEGKWTVTLTPSNEDANQPGVRQFDETITFTTADFSTLKLAEHGFGPAPYQEDVRFYGPGKFSCTQTSDKEGKIDWSGFTSGQDLQGTMVWTKKDGSVVHYDFQGNRS